MLSVSTPALQQLHSSLMASTDADKCFRLMPKDAANLTLKYMELQEDDRTFEFDGRTVLAVPKELETFCTDKVLDVNDEGRLELA